MTKEILLENLATLFREKSVTAILFIEDRNEAVGVISEEITSECLHVVIEACLKLISERDNKRYKSQLN